MKNFYQDLPEVQYYKTMIDLNEVIEYLKNYPAEPEIKRAALVMFRNESANGQAGVNNNYLGIQADAGKWPDSINELIEGVVRKGENRTGNERLFLAFKSFEANINFLIDRVENRGLFIGGKTHLIVEMEVKDVVDFAKAYYKEWVEGDAEYNPTEEEINDIESMYNDAAKQL